MQMGVEYMGDLHALFPGDREVVLHVPFGIDNGHGLEVLLLTGPVTQPCIAQCHLQTAVAKQLLQALDAHAGI